MSTSHIYLNIIQKLNRNLDLIWNPFQLKAVTVYCAFIFTCFYSVICLQLNGQNSLREIAESKKVYIGNIISDGHLEDPDNFRDGKADEHLRSQYNTVGLENYFKMARILPSNEPANIHDLSVDDLRGLLTDFRVEEFMSNERWADFRKVGHVMIWHSQAPQWLNESAPAWTGQQVFDFSRKYILALGQICGNRIDEWDVLNEAISDAAPDGESQWRQGTWYRRANDGSMTDWGVATFENYFKMLFVWARQAQPEALLFYNDYSIEPFGESRASKNRFMREKFKALKACGAPIDGIGFQSHFNMSNMLSTAGEVNQDLIDAIEQSMQDLAEAGLEVVISELDIRICNNERDEDLQELIFYEYCKMALSQPNCNQITFWGLRDEDNWITLSNVSPFVGCQDPLIVEGEDYSPKPAFKGVVDALNTLPDREDFELFTPNPGDGFVADCGGVGMLQPDIITVKGPSVVSPGDQIIVSVNYTATDEQDIILFFQQASSPFTSYAQMISDVTTGTGSIEFVLDIPTDIPPGVNQYIYQALIVPDGGSFESSLSNKIQGDVTVLAEDSQLIISIATPDAVRQGETITVDIDYNAVQGQEIVVWFQLDMSPFTVYQEFRQMVNGGREQISAEITIPSDVPAVKDAYQFQVVLVPVGGGWAERVSNVFKPNIDVLMTSSIQNENDLEWPIRLSPNPTSGILNVHLENNQSYTGYSVYSAIGYQVRQGIIGKGINDFRIEMSSLSSGIYILTIQQGSKRFATRFIKD